MKKAIIPAIISIVSSFLLYSASADTVFNWLLSHQLIVKVQNDITAFQFWTFIIGILGAGFFLPLDLAITKNKLQKRTKSLTELAHFNKNNQMILIKRELGYENISLNTRVFVPRKGLIFFIKRLIKREIVLKLVNIDGISDEHHYNSLSFKIKGEKFEGIVGKSYLERAIVIVPDIIDNRVFNLSDAQMTRVGDVRFCSAIPLFDKKDKIAGIITLDSNDSLDIDDTKKKLLSSNLAYYASFIERFKLLMN